MKQKKIIVFLFLVFLLLFVTLASATVTFTVSTNPSSIVAGGSSTVTVSMAQDPRVDKVASIRFLLTANNGLTFNSITPLASSVDYFSCIIVKYPLGSSQDAVLCNIVKSAIFGSNEPLISVQGIVPVTSATLDLLDSATIVKDTSNKDVGSVSDVPATITITVAPSCGDGTCNGDETGATCPTDCAVCQNVACTASKVCEANACKSTDGGVCTSDSDCESNLNCILTRTGYKCKNLDNGKGLTSADGALGAIKKDLKTATSLSSVIPQIAGRLRNTLISTGATADSCFPPEEKIQLRTGSVCKNLDGTVSLNEPSGTDGALGEIKAELTSSYPLIQRLARIAGVLNRLFE